MKKNLILILMFFVALLWSQCPVGSTIITGTGNKTVLSGTTACIDSDINIGSLTVQQNATLIIQPGVKLTGTGTIIVRGTLDMLAGSIVEYTGSANVGAGGNYDSLLQLATGASFSITGSLTVNANAIGRTSLIKQGAGSVVEACSTYSQFYDNAVIYTGTASSFAYFIVKAQSSGSGSTPITQYSQIRFIEMNTLTNITTGSATYCGPNATSATCPTIWPVGLSNSISDCHLASTIASNLNPCTPPTITGTTSVCVGGTTQLTGAGTAATTNPWVSSNTAVATVSSTGLVTGVSAGTATITYTDSNGCTNTATITVNALPTITGTTSVCINGTTQLTGSGTAATTNPWTSSNTGVATVSSTGLVTGVSVGTSTITYTNNAGCLRTVTVTVNNCALLDSDGDGISDNIDIDDDNDGIPDCTEKGLDGTLPISNYFQLNGSATSVSNYEFQLTPDAQYQSGQAWVKGKIDFSKSFNILFDVYLGTHNNDGADGVAIVFHNDSNGLNAHGTDGSGIGAEGIMNGIVLELDTFWDDPDTHYGGDITDDHGQIWDSDTQYLTGLLTTATSLSELENGSWHPVVITWNATTHTISYTVDGINAGTFSDDLVSNYFGGANLVYYGFTASTGFYANDQRVRYSVTNLCNNLPITVDTDNDGIINDLDLDSDNDGCVDAIEGGADIKISQLVSAGGLAVVGTGSTASNQNLCGGTTCVNAQGLPQFTPTIPTNYSNTTGQTGGTSYNNSILSNACKCFKAGATGGTVLDTNHGITVLGRAGADNGNWPMVRKGAWTALEAKSKGFVINRIPTTAQVNAIPNAVEGMMVYDEEADCLKIYTKDDAPANSYSWRCFSNQTCPDIL